MIEIDDLYQCHADGSEWLVYGEDRTTEPPTFLLRCLDAVAAVRLRRETSAAIVEGYRYLGRQGALEIGEEVVSGELVPDSKRLQELEEKITLSLQGFYDIGVALAEISRLGLYKSEYGSFEEYCQRRWAFKAAHGYRLIQAAEVIDSLPHDLPLPLHESQCRELARLPEAERPKAWKQSLEVAGEGLPTAKDVAAVVQQRLGVTAPAQKALPPGAEPALDAGVATLEKTPKKPTRKIFERLAGEMGLELRAFDGPWNERHVFEFFDAGMGASHLLLLDRVDPSVFALPLEGLSFLVTKGGYMAIYAGQDIFDFADACAGLGPVLQVLEVSDAVD